MSKSSCSFFFLLCSLILAACVPLPDTGKPDPVSQGVQRTLEARQATPTLEETAIVINIQKTLTASGLPVNATSTPIRYTPLPTFTPQPQSTPLPAPTFEHTPKTLPGAMLEAAGSSYRFPEITLMAARFFKHIARTKASSGNTLAMLSVRMKNTGSGMAEYGSSGFLVFDDQGVSHTPALVNADCAMKNGSSVLAGGELNGCIVFDVPDSGHLLLRYAPYDTNRFGERRFLEWELHYNRGYATSVLEPTYSMAADSSFHPAFEQLRLYTYPHQVFGEMQYTGSEPIGKIQSLQIQTYDAEGALVETLPVTLWQTEILPGEKVVFSASPLTSAWQMNRVELSIKAERADNDTAEHIDRDFQIDQFQSQVVDNVGYMVSGTFHNRGVSRVDSLGIQIVAYDRQGHIIGYDQMKLGFGDQQLQPEESRTFSGQVRIQSPGGWQDFDHFEFLFNSLSLN